MTGHLHILNLDVDIVNLDVDIANLDVDIVNLDRVDLGVVARMESKMQGKGKRKVRLLRRPLVRRLSTSGDSM